MYCASYCFLTDQSKFPAKIWFASIELRHMMHNDIPIASTNIISKPNNSS